MKKPGIEFDGIWKKYRRGEVHDSLRDLVPALMRRVTGRERNGSPLGREEFWALQDVSFTVAPGEALGIIGANGAGKSTVLKTLTRVIRPTRGSCRFSGRVGALIEVAAGFHPDLTGRENVFLQGAIMGMPKDLIRRHFDAIVDFSGIEQFIDTPVKRYSSGMNARLGFSIAAHLEPDVLIIDEVLSVGDMQFQQRAFDRLTTLTRGGIPVVIVSHQLERVAQLCTRCILLERGRVTSDGMAAVVIGAYLAGGSTTSAVLHSDSRITIESAEIVGTREVQSGKEVTLRLAGSVRHDDNRSLDDVCLRVRSARDGALIFATAAADCGAAIPSDGKLDLTVRLDMNVAPGVYALEPYIWSAEAGGEIWAGSPAFVQVLPDPRFDGIVQLNPRITVGSVGCKE